MSSIVTIHSFRRGVGKTSLVVSLAVLLARRGQQVALVDMDFQSPGVHPFFGIPEPEQSLNDYLWGKCDILSVVRDVTSRFTGDSDGGLFIVPASSKISDILQSIRIPRNIDHYSGGLEKLATELSLDVILVDAPAGLNENTLQAIAVSNTVVLVLHPDKGDFQGTAVTVDMIRRLQIPSIHLVLNNAPETLDVEDAARQLDETYHCGRGVVLKHSEELMVLSGNRPFAFQYPSHPLSVQLGELAERLNV